VEKSLKVIISAGGTGGHLIPAKHLAEKLKEKNVKDIVFLAKGLSENSIFEKDKFPFVDIPSDCFKKNPFKLFISILNILKGTIKSLFFILKFKPDVVVGFGSYHTFPVILAAKILFKPIILFEPNCFFGKVNKWFVKGSKVVVTQFPSKLKNAVQVKKGFWITDKKTKKSYLDFGLKKDHFTLLVFGGSQGAEYINQALIKIIGDFLKKRKDVQIIHLTGRENRNESIKSFYEKMNISAYVSSYEKNMSDLFHISDLVISRSGAGTFSELIYFEKPSVLIPYPYGDHHQEYNADFMQDVIQGGMKMRQKDDNLLEVLIKMNEHFHVMKENIKKYKEMEKQLDNIEDIVYQIGEKHG
jgi:UDP-N-acetylglucosamine--N-acetylmuramyl-(pentapeptide) pyrophosphoryl-undecaprenol N-acetylglucosamine transferase